jgi:hypothetical protein
MKPENKSIAKSVSDSFERQFIAAGLAKVPFFLVFSN